MHMEIPAQVEWLLAQLKNGGYEAYAVGGCVRDTLLGRLPEDWDITTSAKPEQVKEIFGKTIDTGLKHGTVTVLRDGVGYEITTYRIDGEYEDGRHPREVAFTMELKEDLRRRDFTINAMAYSRETGLVDIFGGVQDLNGRVIRCVGDAVERFTEDALRILRAIRFSAQLDFEIEQATYEALSVIAPNLRRISKERIQSELIKTLLSDCPERILLVNETGMAPCICPDFQMVYEELEKKYGPAYAGKLRSASALDRDKALRLAAFLHPVGEVKAVRILKDLKLDNDTIGRVRTLVGWLEEPISYELACIRRVMSAMSDSLFDDLLTLMLVLRPEQKGETETFKLLAQSVRKNGDCIRLGDLAVDGTDLLEAGMKPGKKLGEKLDELFLLVLEHPEFNEKEFLLAAVRG